MTAAIPETGARKGPAEVLPGAAALCLTVAGMCLYFRGAERIRMSAPPECYSTFLRESPVDGPCIDTVDLEIIAGEVPRPDLLTPVFDTGGAWSMLSDDRRCVFRLQPRANGAKPLWSLTTDLEFRRGRVYCSDTLLSDEGRVILARNLIQYPLDQLLFIHAAAARARAMLVHAAAGIVGGRGVLFAGPSGSGKSTVSRLLLESRSMRFLSDDRVAIRRFGARLSVYGTPWPGDAGAAVNESAPLDAVCFLRHGNSTELRQLAPSETIERLLPVVSVPWYRPDLAEQPLELCAYVLENYPIFELSFRPDARELGAALDELAGAQ
ncbi:MAG: hypothetical protein R3286_02175 [Gammaproteobacteria bacterium]|nr:hypothetical protein [Gammaproteobacteria bacterium]